MRAFFKPRKSSSSSSSSISSKSNSSGSSSSASKSNECVSDGSTSQGTEGDECSQHVPVKELLEQLGSLLDDALNQDELNQLLKDSNYSVDSAIEAYFERASANHGAFLLPAKKARISASPAESSALNVLIASARAPQRLEVFTLTEDADHRLRWDWEITTLSKGVEASMGTTFQRDIAVKEKDFAKGTILRLRTNIAPALGWPESMSSLREGPPTGLPVPHLKSILQKNIRRRRGAAAVRVALELAVLDWASFVRRLCVIVLEDAILHPAFPLLVWLMLVDSKFHDEFPVPTKLVEALLAIVEEVSTSLVYDNFVYQAEASKRGRRFGDELMQGAPGRASAALVRSLVVRAQHGGMEGDVRMLYGAANLWHSRFTSKSDDTLASLEMMGVSAHDALSPHEIQNSGALWYLSESFILELSVASPWMNFAMRAHCDPMQKKLTATSPEHQQHLGGHDRLKIILGAVRASDVCFAGIDFHVCPAIFDDLLTILSSSPVLEQRAAGSHLRGTPEAAFKGAMWHCSSGLNDRKHLSSGIAESSLPHQSEANRDMWSKLDRAHRTFVERRLRQYAFALPIKE